MKLAREPTPSRLGVGGGTGQRGGTLVGADALCTRQLGQQGDKDTAGAGAEIEQPERLCAPTLPIHDRERSLDQGLGVGARVEDIGIDAEAAAVELAAAGDARHGLMLEAACDGRVEPRGGCGLKRLTGAGDIGLMGQSSGVAEQEPRIELRRGDAAVA